MQRALSVAVLLLLAGCASKPPVREPELPRPPAAPPRVDPAPAAVRIGVILPLSGAGPMQEYGTLIREGIDIALQESGGRVGSRVVELVVVDDAGQAQRAAALVDSLEQRSVIAVVGPLLGEAVDAAAASRSDTMLVIVSPTASETPRGRPNAYTLNSSDTRGAEALAEYAARLQLGPIGLLHAQSEESAADARAFTAALQRAGQRVAVEVTYTPGLTTFSQPLQRLKAAGVRAVYIPASARDIRQLAPQIGYYGLQDVQILGSESWADDEVLRTVDPTHLEGAVVSLPLYRTSRFVTWESFVGRYEAAHRRTLDNPYPALGYDAMRLILEALAQGRPDRAELAQRLASITEHRGATGVLSARGGVVSRRPFLVQIRNGQPALLTTSER